MDSDQDRYSFPSPIRPVLISAFGLSPFLHIPFFPFPLHIDRPMHHRQRKAEDFDRVSTITKGARREGETPSCCMKKEKPPSDPLMSTAVGTGGKVSPT